MAKKQRFVEPVHTVSYKTDKFQEKITLINNYYELIRNNVFSRTINDLEIVEELNAFVDERLSELVNFNSDKNNSLESDFTPTEVKMLKMLIGKIDTTEKTKRDTSIVEKNEVIVRNVPQETDAQTVPAINVINENNLDPIIKQALEEEQKVQVKLPTKQKIVTSSPTQVKASPEAINAYAIQQAAANEKRYQKQAHTKQGDHTIAG